MKIKAEYPKPQQKLAVVQQGTGKYTMEYPGLFDEIFSNNFIAMPDPNDIEEKRFKRERLINF